LRNVALRVAIPQEMTPNMTQVRPAEGTQLSGDREIRFGVIPELRPGDRRELVIPVSVDRVGRANIFAQVQADGIQPMEVQSGAVDILPASP
jgi:hypothetical protein